MIDSDGEEMLQILSTERAAAVERILDAVLRDDPVARSWAAGVRRLDEVRAALAKHLSANPDLTWDEATNFLRHFGRERGTHSQFRQPLGSGFFRTGVSGDPG